MRGKNILLVWDRMGDYHRARWMETRRLLSDRNVFAADLGGSDQLYGWTATNDNTHITLSKKDPGKFDFSRITRFTRFVKSNDIGHLCIAGYGRPEYLFFLIYGRLTGRKVLLFAESWYPSSNLFDKIKSWFLNWSCDGFLVSGERAKQHFVNRLRIPASKIKIGYSVVDNDHFSVERTSKDHRTVLAIGRFAPEKNLEILMDSFLKSKLPSAGWKLVVVGGGPLYEKLSALSAGQPITLLGWSSYHELPDIYRQATLFVLPSIFEPWGLVVNEAMAAGLPIIVSNDVGCLPDLVNPENGWTFSVGNQLKNIFDTISSTSPEKLEAMGQRSKNMIGRYSLSLFAANLKALLLLDHDR